MGELEEVGEGPVAEESLALALYCAASAICSLQSWPTAVRDALLLSVNQGGDSDSTGSIAVNILGALIGYSRLPSRWGEAVELATTINQIGDDLATFRSWDVDNYSTISECAYWSWRYSGG